MELIKKLSLLIVFIVLSCSKDSSGSENLINIPILYIDTVGIEINSKEDYIEGSVSIIGSDGLTNLPSTKMKIKGRGNSTWWQGGIWGKKPYQIKFSEKTDVLNMSADKKWVLLAEISDISLIRNKIAREISNIIRFDYVPQAKYIDLYINNEYVGIYLVGQKVEESSNRVNIGDNGYLVEIDTDAQGRIDNDDVYFRSNIWSSHYEQGVFNIKEPNVDYNSIEFNIIKDYINNFESALFGENFKDPDLGYKSFIDLPSFIDWFLVNEIAKNQDAKSCSSIFLNYVPGEKIKMGPVWDFDLAFGNVNYSSAEDPEGFWIKENIWYEKMFEDPYFKELVKERLSYYKDNLDEILLKIDGYELYIAKSLDKNFALYPGLLDPNVEVWPVPDRYDNHNNYVINLKSWIQKRMSWLEASL